jgi:hypothetical protein
MEIDYEEPDDETKRCKNLCTAKSKAVDKDRVEVQYTYVLVLMCTVLNIILPLYRHWQFQDFEWVAEGGYGERGSRK